MLGTVNIPTITEVNLENICEKYLIEEESRVDLGEFVCRFAATDEVTNYFNNNAVITEWQLGCSDWPNEAGGCCFVSWIEHGHLCSFSFNYMH